MLKELRADQWGHAGTLALVVAGILVSAADKPCVAMVFTIIIAVGAVGVLVFTLYAMARANRDATDAVEAKRDAADNARYMLAIADGDARSCIEMVRAGVKDSALSYLDCFVNNLRIGIEGTSWMSDFGAIEEEYKDIYGTEDLDELREFMERHRATILEVRHSITQGAGPWNRPP